MRYFYDTEFIEDGSTIDLISIAMINDRGDSIYLVSNEFDSAKADEWVKENVLAKLPSSYLWVSRAAIANEIRLFISEQSRDDVELWADYAAYDHVALCQLFGKMIDLPPNIPMYTNDFQQAYKNARKPFVIPELVGAHDALVDARHLRECMDLLDAGTIEG